MIKQAAPVAQPVPVSKAEEAKKKAEEMKAKDAAKKQEMFPQPPQALAESELTPENLAQK